MVSEESKVEKKIEKVEEQIEKKEEKIGTLGKKEKIIEKEIKKEEKKVEDLKKQEEKLKEEKEEISFDFKKIKNIFRNKNLLKYSFILLILIPLFFSVYFRVQPSYLPIMDDFALNVVLTNLKEQIADQILKESPNLPPQTLQKEVERRLQAEVIKNQKEIEQAIKTIADGFRSRLKDEDGQTYLLAIDPYTYYRQTKNILENGHVGDKIVNDTPYNTHMLAPLGRFEKPSFHPYFGAFLYKILHPITGKSVMGIFFLIPIIISALAVIPAFFIGRKVSGNFGGFVSAFLVGIHAAFINRTAGGFSDTDAYNVTLPLFIAWFFLLALEAKDLKRKIIYSLSSAFLIGLFSFTWVGWAFILYIIVAAIAFYISYYIFINFKTVIKEKFKDIALRNTIIMSVAFIIGIFVFVSLFIGPGEFKAGILRPFGFITYKAVATTKIWPNVYTTVAEQNYAPFPSVVKTMGGPLLFILSLFGILLTLVKNKFKWPEWIIVIVGFFWLLASVLIVPDTLMFLWLLIIPIIVALIYNLIIKNKEIDIKFAIFIFIWFIATLYASRQGIRFTLILVPAFSIGVGFCLGKIYKKLLSFLVKSIDIPKAIASTILVIILLLFMIAPARTGWDTALKEVPSMDDAWWESLTYIKENSETDAIINSWWDFGHWFKAVADRAVTFDGASQNTPMAHWIGNVLLTDNEKESVGILRMLDCGSNIAFDKLDLVINDSPKSVDILYEIIVQDKETAIKTLSNYGLTEEQTQEVIKYTHCKPPEDFFITSEDMVGKSGVWAHFGSWNFEKSEMYMRVKPTKKEKGVGILMKDYNMTENEATKIYYEIQTTEADQWIAPWPSYSQTVRCEKVDNNTIDCGGITIDFKNQNVNVPKNLQNKPTEIIYLGESGLKGLKIDEKGQFAMAILPDSSAILMAPELSRSMFTILFFYKGVGLNHFDLVKEATTLTGHSIYVWKVDWEGK